MDATPLTFGSSLRSVLKMYDTLEQAPITRSTRRDLSKEIVDILKNIVNDRKTGLLQKMQGQGFALNSSGLGRLPQISAGPSNTFGLPQDVYNYHFTSDVDEENPFKRASQQNQEQRLQEGLDVMTSVLLWSKHLLHRRPQLPLSMKKEIIVEVLLPLLKTDQFVKELHLVDNDRLQNVTSYSALWSILNIIMFPLPNDMFDGCYNDMTTEDLHATSTDVHYRSSVSDFFFEEIVVKHADLLQMTVDLLSRMCETRATYQQHTSLNTPFNGVERLLELSQANEMKPSRELRASVPEAALIEPSSDRIQPLLVHPWVNVPHSVILSRVLNALVVAPMPSKTFDQCLDGQDLKHGNETQDMDNQEESDDDDVPTFFIVKNKAQLSSENIYRRSYARLWQSLLALDIGIDNASQGLKRDDCFALIDLIPDRCLPFLSNPLALSTFFSAACRNQNEPTLAFNCLESYFHLITSYRLPETFQADNETEDLEDGIKGYFEVLFDMIKPNMFYMAEGTRMRELLQSSMSSPQLSRALLEKFCIKLADIAMTVVAEDSIWLIGVIETTVYKNYATLAPLALGVDTSMQFLAIQKASAYEDTKTPNGLPVLVPDSNLMKNLNALAAFSRGLNARTRHTAKRLLSLDRHDVNAEGGGMFKKTKL